MRARAIAVPSERSNAVGTVELECTDDALIIVHRGVGSFRPGYAPGAVTSGTTVTVPWSGILAAAWEGDRLFLHIEESLTPHHRLLLGGFADAEAAPAGEERRRRLLFRMGTVASAVTFGLLLTVTLARLSQGGGAASALLLGGLAAGAILAVGLVAERRLPGGSAQGDAARVAFGLALSLRLPWLVASPSRRPEPGSARTPVPSLPFLLPRSTTAVVITMSAALLSAVLTASWLSRRPAETAPSLVSPPSPARAPAPAETVNEARREADTQAVAAPVAPAPPRPAAEPVVGADTALLSGSCACKRADSVLWRDGLPRVSTLLIERRQRAHNDHLHTELELGVVNNSDAPIPEISLLVQFYEKGSAPGGTRVPTFERPLYFEGPLVAGQAIKWHLEARGDDFEVSGAPEGHLDLTLGDAASAGALVGLLAANHRPVRLHGAMMLTYVGDPRAKEGVLGLKEALREDEAPYIDRLLWALSDVRTCEVRAEGSGPIRTIRACVFNAAREPRAALAVRIRALDHAFRHDTPVEVPPIVVAERVLKVSGSLAPGEGAYTSATIDTSNPDATQAGAFEVHADRAELVF